MRWTHLSSSNCGPTAPVIMMVVTGHWNVWFIAEALCDGWYPCRHHHHHHYLHFINKVKRWNNSPKVPCLVSGRIRIWTQQRGGRVQGLDLIPHCLSLKDRPKKCYGITQPGGTHPDLRDERWLPRGDAIRAECWGLRVWSAELEDREREPGWTELLLWCSPWPWVPSSACLSPCFPALRTQAGPTRPGRPSTSAAGPAVPLFRRACSHHPACRALFYS